MSGSDAFPPELLTQPPDVRLAYFKTKTIAHPRLVEADRSLIQTLYEPAGASVIIVAGPTGVGKTTLRLRAQQQLLKEALPQLEIDRGRVPVVGMEVVCVDSGNFNWHDFYTRALLALDEPLIDRKRDVENESRRKRGSGLHGVEPRAAAPVLRRALEQCLRHRRPHAFFLDEAQHLRKVANARALVSQMDTIKSLASLTETRFVLFGTYDLLGLTNLNAQLNRRTTLIHFPRYRAESAEDIQSFKQVLWTFQRHLPLATPPDLLPHWQACYQRSLGCVGLLKQWLTQAFAAALKTDQATITLADLDRHAYAPSILVQMAREIKEGEDQLTEKPGDWTALGTLLGLEGASPRTGEETVVTAANPRTRTTPPRPRRRVGQRNPIRDPVGLQQHVG